MQRKQTRSARLQRRIHHGFTLIELLVVISIIGVLMGLLLPAVQQAREASRRTTCQNNLKNLGLAVNLHESKLKRFPTGGWGPTWVGDPDRGTGKDQPGGWFYNILPYLEEQPLHELGKGSATAAEKEQYSAQRIGKALPIANCPSRRDSVPYPLASGRKPLEHSSVASIPAAGRSDYAMNAGVRYDTVAHATAIIRNGVRDNPQPDGCNVPQANFPQSYALAQTFTNWPEGELWTGIAYPRSGLKEAHIRDGKSKTYLIGEKLAIMKYYDTGSEFGDDDTLYSGFGYDNYRTTDLPPSNDPRDGTSTECRFGGPHSGIVLFVFCDGSVHNVTALIDGNTHRFLGERNDNQQIDEGILQ